jgi:hypothetical protein
MLVALDLQGGEHWGVAMRPHTMSGSRGEAEEGHGKIQARGYLCFHRKALPEKMTHYVTATFNTLESKKKRRKI